MHQTHRCSVEGCPNLAAYDVYLYDFDLAEGAVVFQRDEDCPVICLDHALENEREGRPFTNRACGRRLTLYLEPAPVYAEALA